MALGIITYTQSIGARYFHGPQAGAKSGLAAAALPCGVLAITVAAGALGLGPAGGFAAAALFTIIVGIVAVALTRSYPHDRFGACNIVTLFRAALASGMAAAVLVPGAFGTTAQAWTLAGVAGLALTLDGFDGWLARRSGLSSDFGARFDMEVDAFLGLILAVLALQSGKAGAWVLLLGLMRYAFVAASLFLRWLAAPLPPRMGRKTVCVIQIAVLIALQVPIILPPVSTALAVLAAVALTASFGWDIRWLYRKHRG